jgi:membrane-associated phospholipid phosphatase
MNDNLKNILKKFTFTDTITAGYLVITILFMLFFSNKLPGYQNHIAIHLAILAVIVTIVNLIKENHSQWLQLLRHIYPLAFLGTFYAETDFLNNVFFQNFDSIAVKAETALFGCLPSVLFYQHFPQTWFNELMNFGYFSYYLILVGFSIWMFFFNKEKFNMAFGIVILSFYFYYITFILFPVAGPQYYLTYPDNFVGDAGIFRKLVKLAEAIGEGPTAAFPSSHVGIIAIILYMSFKDAKKLFWFMLPVSIILFFSTVYLKAHYLIDVFGGFISAPLLYLISKFIINKFNIMSLSGSISVKIVQDNKDMKTFIYLPEKIHKGHATWLPPIYMDERNFFNPKKNRNFNHCDTILLLAFRDEKPVGRIMGIIHRTYNAKLNEKTARFGYLECYNDTEVSHALISHIENWASEKGMNKIIGPYGFSDKDIQGLLIEGFEHIPLLDSASNFPYMIDLVIKEGYSKEIDCVVYKMDLTKKLPDIYENVSQRIQKKSKYQFLHFTNRKQLKPFIIPIFKLINETYKDLYGFVPMDDQDMIDFAGRYLPILDPRFVKIVKEDDVIVSFIIGLPNFTPGIQKAKGRILPFGILYIMSAMKKTKQLDLMLGAVKDGYRGKGLEIAMAMMIVNECLKAGMETLEVHLVLETNKKMFAELIDAGCDFHKRFRVYQKKLN